MPVAVDRPFTMAVSHVEDAPRGGPLSVLSPEKSTKVKNRKLRKLKDAEVGPEHPVAGSSTTAEEPLWSWRSLTESAASRVSPIFTKDGSYFLSAVGSSVKIYSVATGHVVSTLDPLPNKSLNRLGRGEDLTSMILNPQNPYQLFTASVDGYIRVWDIMDAILLHSIDVAQPITHITAHETFKDEVFIAITRPTKTLNSNRNPSQDDNAYISRVSLIPTPSTAHSSIRQSSQIRLIGKARAPLGLAFSSNGAWLVAIGGHKAYIALTSNLKAGFTKLVSPDKLTCLAFHPTEDYFATGDQKGVVRLWYCLNDSLPIGVSGVEKKAPTTTLHWHAHAVSSLAFTSNGAYLLSGGEEAVLVIWQIHTGKKEFVPRVGAPISSIRVTKPGQSEEEYLVGLADASFAFVRAGTMKISRTVARIKLDPAVSYERSPSSHVPLAAHPSSSTIILPSSHPSSLQTFSLTTSKLVSELEVSSSNRVSRREEKALDPSRVVYTVVSDSGEWLATVDSRAKQDEFRGEVYLKLWWWDKKAGSWALNTRIDRPHGMAEVRSIGFRPRAKDHGSATLVTAGGDGTIKIWGIRSTKTKEGDIESFWVARSTTRFRSELPSHVSWSSDGSLLAASFGPYVVLYDPNTTVVLKSFTCPECSTVESSCFLGRSSRYLAVRSHQAIVVWDLILESVSWQFDSDSVIAELAAHPREEAFVAFERVPVITGQPPSTRVLKFGPTSSIPLSLHKLPFRLLGLASCPQRWLSVNDPSSFAFIGVTDTWAAVVFGDHIQLAEDHLSDGRALLEAAPITKQTLFQDIFGRSAFTDLAAKTATTAQAAKTQSWKGKEVEKIFDTPSYLMPPLGLIFDPLMDSFLSVRSPDDEDEEQKQQDRNVDMEAEGEDAPIVVGNRLERIVDQHEMVSLIGLFSEHAIKALPTVNPPVTQVNGIRSVPSKPNGLVSHPSPKVPNTAKANGAATHSQNSKDAVTSSAADPAASPVKAGQKRKKSLS